MQVVLLKYYILLLYQILTTLLYAENNYSDWFSYRKNE